MIPGMLAANPRLDRWVSFEPDGRVRVAFGRMEYGQGIATALAQMAADELDVSFARLRVVPAATGEVPDEGLTVGSMSIEFSGPAIRTACAEIRSLFSAAAAARLVCAPEEIEVRDGAMLRGGQTTGLDYWSLAGDVDLVREATGEAALKTPDRMLVIGQSNARLDLPAKLFGAAFLHDLSLPGLRHARVLRQPSPQARLLSLDDAAVRRAVPDVDILVDHAFVALICETEADAARAHAAAEQAARWDGVRAMDSSANRRRGSRPPPDGTASAPWTPRSATPPRSRPCRTRTSPPALRPLARPTAAASPPPTASRSSATVPSAPRWALRNTGTAS